MGHVNAAVRVQLEQQLQVQLGRGQGPDALQFNAVESLVLERNSEGRVTGLVVGLATAAQTYLVLQQYGQPGRRLHARQSGGQLLQVVNDPEDERRVHDITEAAEAARRAHDIRAAAREAARAARRAAAREAARRAGQAADECARGVGERSPGTLLQPDQRTALVHLCVRTRAYKKMFPGT